MAIKKYPDPILLSISKEVTLLEAKEVADQLYEEIKHLKWGEVAGLAAPQIGINKRVFIAQGKVYINPEITFASPIIVESKEGCFSLQENKFDYIKNRAKCIKMRYMNIKGKIKENIFVGFQAIVLQHEYDHLEGKLCCN